MKINAFSQAIGAQQGLSETVALARKAAQCDIPVVITGESGVGKEVLARAIHQESRRAEKSFIAVNCAAIPESLAESILFGHEKGAFTGAVRREMGKFREAEGGTLFLDEVGELKPDIQTKLLRAIQECEVQPVGAGREIPIDVRIISATNRNLGEAVAQGRFRADLYYRLHVFPIAIARLSQHREDIPALSRFLLARFCLRERRDPIAITEAGMRFLCAQAWTGNVRELENMLCRAAVLAEHPLLDVTDFTALLIGQTSLPGAAKEEYAIRLMDNHGRHKTRHAIEDEAISLTLRHCGNNIAQAAHLLGMGQSTLYKRLSAAAGI